MKNATKVVAAIVALATFALQSEAVQSAVGGVLTAHPNLAAIVAGLAAILALIHAPSKA